MRRRRTYQLFFLTLINLLLSAQIFSQKLYETKLLEFNSKEFDEFAPVMFENGLLFNSFRKQYIYKTEVDLNEKNINDLYYVTKLEGEKWGTLQFFSKELNTKNHEGKASLTKDGNTIYFTRFHNDSAGNIFKSIKSGGEWNAPVLISINSDKYRIKDPCISADGKKMYFASMAPGGYGGYDIYVSVFERGDWHTPKNLGPLVNTKGDEVSPFMHSNGKLYFSSNKLPGLGKFDIFYTREINGKWIIPKNLPEPVNSNRDDLYYFADAKDSTGYFSSNRNRSFDIYSFSSLWPQFGECKPIQKNEYTFIFFEKGSVDNDTTAWLYEWDFGDGTKARGKKAEAEHTFSGIGQYLVQLNVIDTLTGEVLLNEDTYPFSVADIEQAYIFCPDSLDQGKAEIFDASSSNLPSIKKIDYYFWDFGDGERGTGLNTKHSFNESGDYSIKLCVQAAPDENGVVQKACVSKVVSVKSP